MSKAIAQSGWGMFLNFLRYKLEHLLCVLVEVDRFFPSSNIRTEGMRILGLGHSPRGDDVRLGACSEQLSVKRVLPYEQLTLF